MPRAPIPSELSPASKSIYEALQAVSSLAWPILKAQAELVGLDPSNLRPADRAVLTPRLVDAIRRFGSEDKAQRLRDSLESRTSSGCPKTPSQRTQQSVQPNGLTSTLARRVLAELKQYSALAWPLLEAQCKRHGISAGTLTRHQLVEIMPDVEKSLARFTSPEKAKAARSRLQQLAALR